MGLGFYGAAQELPVELQTPELVSVNRMPMRAEAFAFESRELARQREKEGSQYFLSLNGRWKFNWVQDPRKRPAAFYKTDFDDAAWKDFPVPANWELHGYGLPIYVNQPYEFAGHAKRGGQLNPPYDIPADNNPVGSYRKKITVPQSWNGRQVFIHLGAVKSAFFIWVNGEKVGYSEDSKLAAEFDITRWVKPGENLIALQVYRWSDASYLECQDMWRISGIERDVYLYATPRLDLRDCKIITGLDDTYTNGSLQVQASISNYKSDERGNHSRPDECQLEIALEGADGKIVWTEQSGVQKVLGNYKAALSFATKIPAVKTWSAEIPNLYTLYLTLKDTQGKILEVVPQRIGFRSVELKDRNLLVNGKRIFLKGVNRHEHNPTQGHTLTHEDMRKDMEMMKKLNINAVRTSHYPPDPYWLDLCNEYGMYVVEEANIESHGRGYELRYTLGNDAKWQNAHLARITRMYERDKNRTCVITWSLGNEAGNGVNFYEGYEWLKAHDGRPVQYERAEGDYNTDMNVPQYPSPQSLIRFSQGNPGRLMIMSEYAHIMGNSLGNFKDYWDAIENHPYLQGGFIWEWIDQSIDTVKNGKRIKAYGGDFPLEGPVNENLSDNNFCVKGVVTAYRELTPMAIEVKKVYQHIKTEWKGGNLFQITNGYFFKNTDNLKLTWQVLKDGMRAGNGTIGVVRLGPQQSTTFKLPPSMLGKTDGEYFVNVSYSLKEEEPFLPAGYEIASDQFLLNAKPPAEQPLPAKGSLQFSQSGSRWVVSGKGFKIEFDTARAMLTGYTLDKVLLLQSGPQPAFWRAPNDNDIGAGINRSLRMWRNAYEQGVVTQAKASKINDQLYEVVFKKSLVNGDALSEQTFSVYADGSVKVNNHFYAVKGKYPMLMRIGNDLELNKQLGQIQYYGRGPWENYQDRKAASLVGFYKQALSSQYYPYARPQESGNKTDVRWASFTDAKGKGLRFQMADSLLSFAALPYSLDDLDPGPNKKQYHSGELVERDRIYLHMDLQQTGVGGIDSWGAWPVETYRIPYSDHQYSYWIRPVR